MNKFISILLGVILLVGAICLAFCAGSWGTAALLFLKGGIIWLVLLIGLLLVFLGISDLKN